MQKFTTGLLIFISGWGLGWLTYHYWSGAPGPSALPVSRPPSIPVNPEETITLDTPGAPRQVDNLATLLQRNDVAAALEHYESLQAQAGDVAVAEARTQILDHARLLNAAHRFRLAEQLLQQFLVTAYRDVEARVLLAAVFNGQGDRHTAIDQLYEARGYAFRPIMLQRITGRIRSIVAELAQTLTQNDDQGALLALYQQLIQLEPYHAPYFIELAVTQLALDDKAAARRSLLLVAQDPAVGAQAQTLLEGLSIALAGKQDTASRDGVTAVAGIPLHRSGNHFIVDAQPARGRRIRLLIDTGASMTIFTPDVMAQRGIRYQDTGRTAVFNTANGPVRAPVYTLDSLAVGDWQVRHLDIGILELGSGSGVNGLLGMNFLKHFQFFIDQNEGLLRLSAN